MVVVVVVVVVMRDAGGAAGSVYRDCLFTTLTLSPHIAPQNSHFFSLVNRNAFSAFRDLFRSISLLFSVSVAFRPVSSRLAVLLAFLRYDVQQYARWW